MLQLPLPKGFSLLIFMTLFCLVFIWLFCQNMYSVQSFEFNPNVKCDHEKTQKMISRIEKLQAQAQLTTIMEKIVGTPDAIYYYYPHAFHWNRKWTWHCSIESRGSCFYHNPSPPPSINFKGSCFWQHDLDQLFVFGGEGGHFFS